MRTLFIVAALAAAAHADAPIPLAKFEAQAGTFIDDAFALRDDAKALAYLTTDGAHGTTLHLVEFGKPEVVVKGLPEMVARLRWLGEARLLIVSRDASHRLVGQVYTAKGPSKELFGPADDITVGTVDGKPAVVGYSKSEKKAVEHTVWAIHRDSGQPLGREVLREDSEGRIANPNGAFKLLWWEPSYARAAVLAEGTFDKARDMRRPSRFATFDLFKKRLSDDAEIADLVTFTRVTNEHKKHADQSLFVHFSEDLRKLLLTDDLLEHELTLARALSNYETTSLAYQRIDDEHLALVLKIDPTNPTALSHKKADPDDVEVYLTNLKTHRASLALRLPGEGRPCAWHVAGGHIALLRKSKGFDRGGVSLAVYPLAPPPKS